jgi:hypothetical protein
MKETFFAKFPVQKIIVLVKIGHEMYQISQGSSFQAPTTSVSDITKLKTIILETGYPDFIFFNVFAFKSR